MTAGIWEAGPYKLLLLQCRFSLPGCVFLCESDVRASTINLLGLWNFSRHAQKFWVNGPCTSLLCQDGEVSVPTQLLELQDRCWLNGPRACGMGAGCCCPLLWHLPPSLVKGQGWLSQGCVTHSQHHTTSFPLPTVGALSRWIWGSAAGTW